MAKAVAAIVDDGLRNIRLFGGDAALLLDWLPPHSLGAVDLLYPDPWPKRRHWKRRFVSPDNLDRIARVLMPGGVFRFASDIDAYVAWTLLHLLAPRRISLDRGARRRLAPALSRLAGRPATRRRRSRPAGNRPISSFKRL